MAKPRIFVSSTYYDLRHIRQGLDAFIKELGYEPVLFENGDIPFSHEKPLDHSCYNEIKSCHILVLIIGGRFGSPTSDENKKTDGVDLDRQYIHYNSITQKEYATALEADIPVYIFVEKGVNAEYGTYKKNRDNKSIVWQHVDSINVFQLLESVYSQKRNNLIRDFDKLSDITHWLRDQWAGLLAEFLLRRTEDKKFSTLTAQLNRLEGVVEALKSYSESLIRSVEPQTAEKLIEKTDQNIELANKLSKFKSARFIRDILDKNNISTYVLYRAFCDATSMANLQSRIRTLLKSEKKRKADLYAHGVHPDLINEIRLLLNLPFLKDDLGSGEF